MNNKVVSHHGIVGMRWGIRRKRGSDGRVEASSDHAESRKLLKKPTMTLSNADIKTINKRLNLEQELGRLDPTALGEGKRRVRRFLDQYGNGLIGAAAGVAVTITLQAVKKSQ